MSDLDRVLRALNHPLRRRILRELLVDPRSASSLAKEFKLHLGVVSYHLNTVLAKECDVIELVGSAQRRGALEKFYRLRRGLRSYSSSGATRKGKKGEVSLEESVIALVLGIAEVGDIRAPSSPPS